MRVAIPAALLAMILLCPITNAAENSPAAAASPGGHHLLSHLRHHGNRPAGLPSHWDKRIPLPTGVAVKNVKPPAGAAQAVEFSAPDDYDKTVAFYKEALPKAGFQLGPRSKGSGAQGIQRQFHARQRAGYFVDFSRRFRPLQGDDADRLHAGERMDPHQAREVGRPRARSAQMVEASRGAETRGESRANSSGTGDGEIRVRPAKRDQRELS